MGVLAGLLGNVYFGASPRTTWASSANSAGIYVGTAPSLTAITAVRNVTLNETTSEGDGSSRASTTKLGILCLDEESIEFELPYNPTDAGWQALRNAKTGREPIALAILDGSSATSGTFGRWADYICTEFNIEQPLEKEMSTKVKVVPTSSAVPPQWVQCS